MEPRTSPGVPVMATPAPPPAEATDQTAPPAVSFGHGRRPETATQVQLAQFITVGGPALAGNGEGGYQRTTGVEHYLPQVAIIDGRSLARRPTRPEWERANAYIAPNAYDRSVPLGAIESFDCKPAGGEKRNPTGSGETGTSRWMPNASSRTARRWGSIPAYPHTSDKPPRSSK